MRKAFLVYVDLDPTPGEFHTQESAEHAIRSILVAAIGHYHPTIVLAPEEYQPENVAAHIDVELKLPQRANDYLLDLQQRKPMGDYDNFERINLSPEAEQARINSRVMKGIGEAGMAEFERLHPEKALFKGILNDPNIALDLETTGIEPAKARVILHPSIAGYLKRSAAELMEQPGEVDEIRLAAYKKAMHTPNPTLLETPNMFKVAPGTQNYDDLSDVEKDLFGKGADLVVTKGDVSRGVELRAIDRNEVTLIDPIGDLREPTEEELDETVRYTEENAGLD